MRLPKSPERSVTKVRIVEAAAQIFARQGFKAATTREIAYLADLNEVTLYRYFPRKPDLFWAAVESRLSRVRMERDLQISLADSDAPAIVIPMIARFLVMTLSQQPELQRLLHVAVFELPEAKGLIREHLGPVFDAVSGYFFRCVEKGAIASVGPSLATLGLVGVVIAHETLYPLFSGEVMSKTDTEKATAALAQLWLRALQAPTAEVSSANDLPGLEAGTF